MSSFSCKAGGRLTEQYSRSRFGQSRSLLEVSPASIDQLSPLARVSTYVPPLHLVHSTIGPLYIRSHQIKFGQSGQRFLIYSLT